MSKPLTYDEHRRVLLGIDRILAENPRTHMEWRIGSAILAALDRRELNREEAGAVFTWLTARAFKA